ncbi:hypothetical protein FDA94_29755 [Herbidospora galbida]|uniref:Uncharacterized protein n=1 Tax=Herbidospora galbida TaxID=2575442 RepID=A0A4U3M7Y5_9ACTN|nr:hypothetical protein [Herbidospora galbida]TKK84329.1 hypothetical protein FDA94_29755 [Herbidospora galbida]
MNAPMHNQTTSKVGETAPVSETVKKWIKKNNKIILTVGGAAVVAAAVLISRTKGLDTIEEFGKTELFPESVAGIEKRQSPRPHSVSGYQRMTKYGMQSVSPYERGAYRAA